jgi:AbrB family looped-hinge helix DNA binding protein
MVTRTVKVDDKDRILIPRELREKAGIKDSAQVELEGGRIVIKADSLLDSLAKHPIKFTTEDISKLRRTALQQGLKEIGKGIKR